MGSRNSRPVTSAGARYRLRGAVPKFGQARYQRRVARLQAGAATNAARSGHTSGALSAAAAVAASIFADAAPPALDRKRPAFIGVWGGFRGGFSGHGARFYRDRGKPAERDVGQHADHKVRERAFIHVDVIG